eukprot:TRINITY_DN3310_c0_g1_i1.p1 TRINITY_DN3310_c0_g1~~TRINITY_DN3310_c0_g1_i1.p1  ORF type:complete len:1748 (-),score=331.88 TRINITY_DN3310_c0_g1_i1:88-5331(-)
MVTTHRYHHLLYVYLLVLTTNLGSIKSEEERGYVVSLGIEGISGFLSKSNSDYGEKEITIHKAKQVLKVGQVLLFLVLEKKSSVLLLSCTHEDLRKATVKTKSLGNISHLRPGLLIKGTISKVLDNGLYVNFCEYFNGTIDMFHLSTLLSCELLEQTFKVGQKVVARVLFVTADDRKSIGLSMLPPILEFVPVDFPVSVGDKVSSSAVKRIDPKVGVALQIQGGQAAYLHISKLSVKLKGKPITTLYSVGDNVSCRVMSLDYMDCLVNVSCRKSDMKAQFVSYDGLHPGLVVTGTIESVQPKFISVSLGHKITATCPHLHMGETTISDPTSKFKVDQKVTCRILYADIKFRNVLVTFKKSLIYSDLPIIDSLSVQEGIITHGYITHVRNTDCVVGFYGHVHGTVGRAEMANYLIEDPRTVFKVGQVLPVRVIGKSFNALKLSFLLEVPTTQDPEITRKLLEKYSVGDCVTANVTRVSEQYIDLSIRSCENIDGNSEGETPDEGKKSEFTILARLMVHHLSDILAHTVSLRKDLTPGNEMKDLMVIGKDSERLWLTNKQSYRHAFDRGLLPSHQSDIKAGQYYYGTVSDVRRYGVFVQFLEGLIGFAHVSNLADMFLVDVLSCFFVGQTVFVHCLGQTDEKGVRLSLKPSMCYSSPLFNDSNRLWSYFQFYASIPVKQNVDWSHFVPGRLTKATVTKVEANHSLLSFEKFPTVIGFCHQEHQPKNPVSVGTSVECFVLDLNKVKQIVDLSLKVKLITPHVTAPTQSFEIHENQCVTGKIELVEMEYMVVSIHRKYHLPENKDTQLKKIVFVSTRSHNDQFYIDPHSVYKIGHKLPIIISYLPNDGDSTLRILGRIDRNLNVSESKKLGSNDLMESIEVEIGQKFPCVVVDKLTVTMYVKISNLIDARIHVSEVSDELSSSHPFASYNVGDTIPYARVIGIHSSPYDRSSNKRSIVELSIRPSVLNSEWDEEKKKKNQFLVLESLKPGMKVRGWIEKISSLVMWVQVSPTVKGVIFLLDVSNDVNVLQNLNQNFKVGEGLECVVMKVDLNSSELHLSLRGLDSKFLEPSELEPGMVVPGRIYRVTLKEGIVVQLFSGTYGEVDLPDIADEMEKDPETVWVDRMGDVVECCVLGSKKVKAEEDRKRRTSFTRTFLYNLSLRPSVVKLAKETEKFDQELPTPGTVVRGYVWYTNHTGCFVKLPNLLRARVMLRCLSDKFITNPAKSFPPGKLIKGLITKVDQENRFIDMSLKKSLAQEKKITFDQIKPNMVLVGIVKSITDYGVFVTIHRCGLVGLCHISVASDGVVTKEELKKLYSVGDRVKTRILRTNPAKKQLSLSLAPSQFKSEEADQIMNQFSEEEEEEESYSLNSQEENDSHAGKGKSEDEDTGNVESEDEDAGKGESEDQSDEGALGRNENLDMTGEGGGANKDLMDVDVVGETRKAWGIDWGGPTVVAGCDDRNDGGGEEHGSAIEGNEEAQKLFQSQVPTTPKDFDRIIMETPNSSYAWIRYAAYWISKNNLEKTRETIQNALQRINPSLETEKFNVWVAWLNMENTYGNEETYNKVFHEALQYNDQKKIYLQAIKMFSSSNKTEKVEELYKILLRKFKENKGPWIKYAIWLFKQKKPKNARDLLKRSLTVLPHRKHLETISKFGQLEYKFGKQELGRTIFEDLLATYPKRINIWSVYIDQEKKLGNVEKIRELYERVTSLSISAKKMKFMMKEFIQFEQDHGDEDRIEKIKQKAVEYINSR